MPKIGDLAEQLHLTVEGDREREVLRITSLDKAGPQDLSFVVDAKHRQQALDSAAGVVVAPPGMALPGKTVMRSDHPYLSVVRLTPLLHPPPRPPAGVHPSAVVGAECQIHPSASIGPNAVLGRRVRVGKGTVVGPGVVLEDEAVLGEESLLHPNVTIGRGCVVGNRVIIHAGTVLGSDGYGFIQLETHHEKIPHLGNVVVEDDVELGANNAIDRATYGSTLIGRGTKVDNLVHIAHNVVIGEHSLILGQVGFAGSTRVGARFTISGQSGVVGHLEVPERVTVGPKSLLVRPGNKGEVYYGIPARPYRDWQRSVAHFNSLDKWVKRIKGLLSKEKSGDGEGGEE